MCAGRYTGWSQDTSPLAVPQQAWKACALLLEALGPVAMAALLLRTSLLQPQVSGIQSVLACTVSMAEEVLGALPSLPSGAQMPNCTYLSPSHPQTLPRPLSEFSRSGGCCLEIPDPSEPHTSPEHSSL